MVPRTFADGAAIGVSMLCMIHCLAVPALLAVAPWIVPGFFADERFHAIAVALALPLSAFALAGTLQARPSIVVLAAAGLTLLLIATLVHEEVLEVGLTVAGALFVALAHVRNLMVRSAH